MIERRTIIIAKCQSNL